LALNFEQFGEVSFGVRLCAEEALVIKINVLYPNRKNAKFDIGYYLEKHMPLSIQLLSPHPGYRGYSVERGINGLAPGVDAAYTIICYFMFDSIESFNAALAPHAATLQGDVPNYTDVQPIFQVSEVLISG
jgi:uncharacterized protein (TIGR02118 family)